MDEEIIQLSHGLDGAGGRVHVAPVGLGLVRPGAGGGGEAVPRQDHALQPRAAALLLSGTPRAPSHLKEEYFEGLPTSIRRE